MMTISILKSLKNILNVLFFFLLFYIIFGIFGVYFMSGILHKRCYPENKNIDNYNINNNTTSYVLCYDDGDCMNNNECLSLSANPHHGIFPLITYFFRRYKYLYHQQVIGPS